MINLILITIMKKGWESGDSHEGVGCRSVAGHASKWKSTLHTAHNTQHTAQCTLHMLHTCIANGSRHCTMHNAHCTHHTSQHTAHNTLRTTHCTMHMLHIANGSRPGILHKLHTVFTIFGVYRVLLPVFEEHMVQFSVCT